MKQPHARYTTERVAVFGMRTIRLGTRLFWIEWPLAYSPYQFCGTNFVDNAILETK